MKLKGIIRAADLAAGVKRLRDDYRALNFELKDIADPHRPHAHDKFLERSDVSFLASRDGMVSAVALVNEPVHKVRQIVDLDRWIDGHNLKSPQAQLQLDVYRLKPLLPLSTVLWGTGSILALIGALTTIYSNIGGKDLWHSAKPSPSEAISQASIVPRMPPVAPIPLPTSTAEPAPALAPAPAPALAPALAGVPEAPPIIAAFVPDGRWTTMATRDCSARFYVWTMARGFFHFVDESGGEDVEQVLRTPGAEPGYVTETLSSHHAVASTPIGSRWQYDRLPSGVVSVQNLSSGHGFRLYRCR